MTGTFGRAVNARRLVAMSTLMLVLAAGFGVAPASAGHVGCGSVINTDTVLDSDVGPCVGRGLTVEADNITLDLNGHTVSGTSGQVGEGAGIFVGGVSGVLVTGGTVRDFDAGIVIELGSGNTIADVEVRDNIGSGATDFGDGIVISSSSGNVIRDSQVVHNGPFDGIGVFVTGTSPAGASDGNVIENNFVLDNNIGFSPTNNQDIGIRLEPGTTQTRVESNVVQGSGLDGIQVFGRSQANVVRSNVVSDNGAIGVPTTRFGNGILVAGTGNLIQDNQADRNFASGIAVSGTDNDIFDNSASGNAIAPVIAGRTTADLKDFRADCDNNEWRGNAFVTADPACTTG